jgi:hypothetical protein
VIYEYPARARGMLAHHFWGEYHATIALVFQEARGASLALPKLGAGWRASTKNADVLVWGGTGEAFKACVDVLASFGADREKVQSLRYSVDHGEWFDVAIPVRNPDQLALPL